MAPQGEGLIDKPGEPTLIPRSHGVKKKTDAQKLSSDFHR